MKSSLIAGSVTLRILLIDDQEIARDATAALIDQLGWSAVVCSSASDALKRFNSELSAFDVIVTDLNMPEMNGIELIRRLRSSRINCPPIVLQTGGNFDNQSHHVTPDALLQKPVDIKHFRDVIESLVDRSARGADDETRSIGD